MKKPIGLFMIILLIFSCTNRISKQEFSLEDLQKRTFRYFWVSADPVTNLVPDRWPTPSFSSIAAQGFGYPAWIIGIENGWVTREDVALKVKNSLKFLYNLPQGAQTSKISGYKGFYYHFLDMKTGSRFKKVELSSIDTGLLMAGILTCMSYFDRDNSVEAEIRQLADSLYRRVEWDWMFDSTQYALSMGWHPENGFIPSWWSGYNEAMILMILAIASPTHPIPANAWQRWCSTYIWAKFQGYEHVNFGPLFGHQYSHLFIDFKGLQDSFMLSKGIDYFENSRRATLANRAYCISNHLGFSHYNDSIWGLTACDGPKATVIQSDERQIRIHSYSARGAAANYLVDDGTIAPTAAGGSIPFAPEICIPALRAMYTLYGDKIYGMYGFKDAFNPFYKDQNNEFGWYDIDYLGIDQGPILIMIQNYYNQLIWNILRKNSYIREGLIKAGFKGGWLES